MVDDDKFFVMGPKIDASLNVVRVTEDLGRGRREGGKERGREGGREGGKEGGREGDTHMYMAENGKTICISCTTSHVTSRI